MAIDVSAVGTTTTTTPTTTSADMATTVSDYQTFLEMMTTQLKNQDPTDPMDASDFAVQLATFSGVEQQVKTNDLLNNMLTAFSQMQISQMSAWVGNDVRVAAPVYFDGTTPIDLSPNPAAAADSAVLVVKDSNGNEVSRSEIPTGTATYAWDGKDENGDPLPAGVYDLSLESYNGEELLGSTEIEHYGEVLEVRSSAAGATLLMAGEIEVPALYVTGIRPPDV